MIVPDVGGAFGSKGVIARRGRRGRDRRDRAGPAGQVGRGPVENFLGRLPGTGHARPTSSWRSTRAAGSSPCARTSSPTSAPICCRPRRSPPHTTAMLMTGVLRRARGGGDGTRRPHRQGADRAVPRRRPSRGGVLARADGRRAARELGLDPVELRRRNLIRSFPYRERARLDVRLRATTQRCLDRAVELAPATERRSDGRRHRRGDVRGARGRQLGERAGHRARGRARDRAQRLLAARPGARDDVRADRRRPARDRCRPTSSCGSATPRCRGRRHVREPVGGHGRLGAGARARADRRARASSGGRAAAALPGRGVRARARLDGSATAARSLLGARPPPGSRPRCGSSPIWCSARAPTPPSVEIDARHRRAARARGSRRWTTPARSSTRCSPRARCSAGPCRDSARC